MLTPGDCVLFVRVSIAREGSADSADYADAIAAR